MALDSKLIQKKLEVLLQDQALVGLYLKQHGPSLDGARIQAFKAEHLAAKKTSLPGKSAEDDPTYRIHVKCPVCQKADILCYELKSKSLAVKHDRFMVPRYEPAKGFKPLNYSTLAVTVCPDCLFASPDKRDFITHPVGAGGEVKSQVNFMVLNQLREETPKRKALLQTAEEPGSDPEKGFAAPRSLSAAVLSYRLAMERARAEMAFQAPLSAYKAGMYALKIALLDRDAGRNDTAILKEAVKFFTLAFKASDLPSPELEFQLLYTIIALNLRLGEEAECQAYLAVLEKVKADMVKQSKDLPEVPVAAAERWLEKAKDLWTSRQEADLWAH